MAYQEDIGADKLKVVSALLKTGETTLAIGVLVKVSDNNAEPNEVVAVAADTDQPLGIVVNQDIAAGETGAVMTDGECPALTGGTFSRGAELTWSSSGLITATSGDLIVAQALEDSTASGQLRQVIFKPFGRLKA